MGNGPLSLPSASQAAARHQIGCTFCASGDDQTVPRAGGMA